MTAKPKSTEPPMRQQLIDLSRAAFTGGRDAGERAYLVRRDGANVALYGLNAKRALAGAMYDKTGQAPGRSPLDEAWMVVEHQLGETPKRSLPLRVGVHDGNAVIDMGDAEGRAIVISSDGWEVMDRSPITFARTKATMPLPEPVKGGDVNRLFDVINVAESQRRLMLGWLVASFTENIAHPIVTLRGEQGSAKSTTAKVLVAVIDPTAAPLVSPPKDDDRWDASCSAHYVVSVDNASKVSDWWSDAMCRAVTGAGIERRALYTDGDIHVASYRRCIILNGISLSGMLRTDLLERSMAFDLRRPEHRLTDTEIDERLADVLPGVLGGLLDLAVAVAAAEVPRPDLPRMADFGLILAKLDHVLGEGPSAVQAYAAQIEELFDESFESDVIAQSVIAFMDYRKGKTFEGTTDGLLRALRRIRISEQLDGGWFPESPNQLGNALPRSALLLRAHGIEVDNIKVNHGGRQARGKRVRSTTAFAGREPGHADTADTAYTAYTPISTLCFLEKVRGEEKAHIEETGVPGVTGVRDDDHQAAVVTDGTACPRCERPNSVDANGECRPGPRGCYPRPARPTPNFINT